ncbi:MAG TPA: endonuclease III [bacterium]|nr:endonuclease III [bacterium]
MPRLSPGRAPADTTRARAPAARRRDVARVDRALEARYGRIRRRDRRDALGTLIATIISQHTSDTNTRRAFARLRAQFPTWTAVCTAPLRAVIDAIRPAGLSARKAPRIQAVLRRLAEERGTLSLAFLRRWPAARAKAWLLSLDGVGPKTAAIVLVFGLGKPSFAVDTHVYRIGTRIGLIPARLSAEQAHDWMDALVRPARRGPFHLLLIRHGREVCTARAPRCELCPVRRWCAYYATRHRARIARGERT